MPNYVTFKVKVCPEATMHSTPYFILFCFLFMNHNKVRLPTYSGKLQEITPAFP